MESTVASDESWLQKLHHRADSLTAALWRQGPYHRLPKPAEAAANASTGKISNKNQAWMTQVQSLVSVSEEHYQKWLQKRFNLLFSATRQQQLQTLGVDLNTLTISPEDRWHNRQLARLAAIVGFAIASHLLYSPLILPALILALWSSMMGLQRAWRISIKQRRLTMGAVMSVFSVGVWLSGYLIAGGLSGIFIGVIQKFIGQTRDQSRRQLVNIFGQQPRTVWQLIDGVEVEVPFEGLQTGDIVVVQAGQMIPVDGVVTQGMASVDQHRLTGEAQALEKGVGDRVLAATVVLGGRLCILVEKTGEATLAAQIGAILRQTTDYHLTIQTRGERTADQALLPSVLCSALALVTVGTNGALAALYSTPGIGMYMMGPLTLLNYLNLLAQRNILVKDGRSLELLHTVDTVVFDKTGTLTLDQFQVRQIHCCAAYSETQILSYAAAAEQRQAHPLAKAILAVAQEWEIAVPSVADAQYEVGYGLKVWLATNDEVRPEDRNGKAGHEGKQTARLRIRVGSERFMHMEELAVPTLLQTIVTDAQAQGHSFVFVAVGDEVAGAIELQSVVRPEAKAIVADLHKRKLKILVISGDQTEPTRQLAADLGIDDYYANVLPQQKAELVAQLHQTGHSVCFVGDGINDAIALKQARVSVSLRGATSVATDTAQIVLMDQSLCLLPTLFDMTHEMHHNLNVTYWLTIAPAVVIVGGVFLAHGGIPLALSSHLVSMLSTTSNAMWPVFKPRPSSTSGE